MPAGIAKKITKKILILSIKILSITMPRIDPRQKKDMVTLSPLHQGQMGKEFLLVNKDLHPSSIIQICLLTIDYTEISLSNSLQKVITSKYII